MQGEFAVAHSLCDEDHRILEELGLSVLRAASNGIRATIYSDAGKPLNAERELRAGIKKLRNLGEALYSTGLEVQLARVLLEQGEGPEAQRVLGPDDAAPSEDVGYLLDSFGLRARLLALGELYEQAIGLAVRAVNLADQTDSPDYQGGARVDLARVLRTSGEPEASSQPLTEAVQLFEAKSNLLDADLARALLQN